MMRFTALLGTLALLLVSPLLSTYRNACRCECCTGQGCNARLAIFNVGWVAYGFSTLWVLPSILELPTEMGGKVLFGLAQGISISAVATSRNLAQQADARAVGDPVHVTGGS